LAKQKFDDKLNRLDMIFDGQISVSCCQHADTDTR